MRRSNVAWRCGLNIRNGGAPGLPKRDFGTGQQSPQQQISEGKNDIEVAIHVAMMEQMVAVEAEEYSTALDVALLDCTSGGATTQNRGHMDAGGVIKTAEDFRCTPQRCPPVPSTCPSGV